MKKRNLQNVLSILMAVILLYGTVVLPDKVYAVGSTAAPVVNLDFNSSLNSSTGSLVGGANIANGTLNLTGNGYLNLAIPQAVKNANSMSIVMNVNMTNDTARSTIFSMGKDKGNFAVLIANWDDGTTRFSMEESWGAEYRLANAPSISANQWHSVAYVQDNSAGKLFLDGVFVSNNSDMAARLTRLLGQSGAFIRLGSSSMWPDPNFIGNIDNLKIYDYALSDSQVQDEATNSGITIDSKSVVNISTNSFLEDMKKSDNGTVFTYTNRTGLYENKNKTARFNVSVPTGSTCSINPSTDYAVRNGDIDFTVTNSQGQAKQYKIKIINYNNSVLPGSNTKGTAFAADPEILTYGGKYYIYATTDGVGGDINAQKFFYVYESSDLINWVNRGKAFDITTAGSTWANYALWAPAVEQRNGKFYMYYTASPTTTNTDHAIGVAIADSPIGPFVDASTNGPLVTKADYDAATAGLGQCIDVDVFQDSDGTPYMYIGNYSLIGRKMNTDMVSFSSNTSWVCLEGPIGRKYNQPGDFCEGTFVNKRNGIYYFSWSSNGCFESTYNSRYGTATSPLGPITYKGQLIKKDDDKQIYATGHHCILNVPNTDDWYIIYHRWANPSASDREVCIDKLEYDSQGNMIEVKPTHEGIQKPVLAKYTTLNPKVMDMITGDINSLTATLSDGLNSTITWASSNTAVATVDSSGNVTATGVGSAYITASASGYTTSTSSIQVASSRIIESFSDNFNTNTMTNWIANYGSFVPSGGSLNEGTVALNSDWREGKAYVAYSYFSNVRYEMDVKVSDKGDAGMIFRASNLGSGINNYQGYYVGISSLNDQVILGKSDGSNWTQIATATKTLNPNTYYHLKVDVVGNTIKVYFNNERVASLSVTDSSYTTGVVGVRNFSSQASFDNIQIDRLRTVVPR